MRSQLDCVDSRLPGTGVFDIKTRAAVPIRLDILNYEVKYRRLRVIDMTVEIDGCGLAGKLGIFNQESYRSPRELRKGIL